MDNMSDGDAVLREAGRRMPGNLYGRGGTMGERRAARRLAGDARDSVLVIVEHDVNRLDK